MEVFAPDVVAAWDDTEVARRWLMLCPVRRKRDQHPEDPSEFELNSLRNDPARIGEIRSRLSDISWWMRLLSQKIGRLFSTVAGKPTVIETTRSRTQGQRYHVRSRTRELLVV